MWMHDHKTLGHNFNTWQTYTQESTVAYVLKTAQTWLLFSSIEQDTLVQINSCTFQLPIFNLASIDNNMFEIKYLLK